jgi:catechol 2,3-dioxygenase-like lactoylglutathione lyase family enzyme
MRVANISLSTNDLEANHRFYAEALGVPVLGVHERMVVFEGNLVIDAAHGNPPTTGAHVMLVADDLDAVSNMIGGYSSSMAAPSTVDDGAPASEGRDRGRSGANGVSVDVVTAIEEMGSFFRYSFVWTMPDGSRSGGTDFCEVAEDGRMKLITVWSADDDFPLPDAARTA